MEATPVPRDWSRLCRGGALGLLLVATAAIWLAPADLLVGSAQADLGQQFLAWRTFTTDSLRAGHWPLWNPFSYAGEPFLGGFQSALYYPPSLLLIALPPVRALHLLLLLHLAFLGGGLYYWARQRALPSLAAAGAGWVLVCSGPVFPHLYAGHVPNLCTLAWTPWILANLDGWARSGRRRCLAYAAAAVGLQLLAGQLQYVYYTGIAAGLQALLATCQRPRQWARALPAVAGVYAAGAVLAAAQLVPGWAAAREGLRQTALDPAFAAQFSLPPENLLTALAPGFFGDPVRPPYWGRCYSWEMSCFLGVTGLALVGAALADPVARRRAGPAVALAAALTLLALGSHTPLFAALYRWAPGMDRFRGWSKFTFPAAVFLALAVAEGAAAVLRGNRLPRGLWIGAALLGFGCAGGAAWLHLHPSSVAPWLEAEQRSGESYLPASLAGAPATLAAAAAQAVRDPRVGRGLRPRRRGHPVRRPVAAGRRRASSSRFCPPNCSVLRPPSGPRSTLPRPPRRPSARSWRPTPGEYRVQNLLAPNNGVLLGAADIWGNDPALSRRYAEFMTLSQGGDPRRASQNVAFRAPSPLYALLRLRYVFTETAQGIHVYPVDGALQHLELVSHCVVAADPAAELAALRDPAFDPRRTVLLESAPSPWPAADRTAGTCRLVRSTPDELVVEAQLAAPALLLVTDGYSRDWRATALPGSAQASYQVLPADYVLRATPLGAGHHLIRFHYEPAGRWVGLFVSAIAWLAWLGWHRWSVRAA